MRPWNPFPFNRGGAPITGSIPVRLVVQGGSLTGAQSAAVQSFFIACCEEHRLSVAPSFSRSRTLAYGVWAKVNIIGGVASVLVSVQGEQGAAGIGMRLVGWDGAPIPELSTGGVAHYYLATLDAQGKWNITRRASLVGGQAVWVGTDRTRWLSTVLSEGDDASDAGALTYFRNREVSDTARPSNIYPAAVRAARRGAAAASESSPVSFLRASNDTIELLQRDAEGAYVAVDSIQVDGGGVSVLSAAGNFALATAGDSAHLLTLSPALGVVKEWDITAPEATISENANWLEYSVVQPYAAPPSEDVPTQSNAHWAGPPDLGFVELIPDGHDWAYDSTVGGEPVMYYTDSTLLPRTSEYMQPLRDAGIQCFSRGIPGAAPYLTTGQGVWSYSQIVGTHLQARPTRPASTSGVYRDHHQSTDTTHNTPWRGMTHDGELVRIDCDVETTRLIDGTTTFDWAFGAAQRIAVDKTVEVEVKTTWNLPGGRRLTSVVSTSERYVENTASMEAYETSGTINVSSTVSKSLLSLLHYDADTDCAVFLKEDTSGSGTTSWEKKEGSPGTRKGTTPHGSYYYTLSAEPAYAFSGSSRMTVCVYIKGVLSYEEVLATGPCSGGSVMYEPQVYSDMEFDLPTAKPSGGFFDGWVETEGPGGVRTVFKNEPALYYLAEPAPVNYHMVRISDWEELSWPEIVAKIIPMQSSGIITFMPEGYMLCTSDGRAQSAPADQLINGTGQYILGGNVFVTSSPDGEAAQLDTVRRGLDVTDTWTGATPSIYPANASMSERFDVSASTAKDARTGGIALEIHYSYDGFAEPKDRARILLVSSEGVTQLDELLKPSSGAEKFEFKTTFLATI